MANKAALALGVLALIGGVVVYIKTRGEKVMQLVIQPSAKDAYLKQLTPDENNGGVATLQMFDTVTNYIKRSILEFDISGLPAGITLVSAKLQLWYRFYSETNPDGKTVWAYKLTRTDWVELQATWNDYKAATPWTAGGGDYVTAAPAGGSTTFPAAINAWMSWDVLPIVQDAYDNTIPAEFLLKFELEESAPGYSDIWWSSKEEPTEINRPKLTIGYTLPVKSGNIAAKMVAAGLI